MSMLLKIPDEIKAADTHQFEVDYNFNWKEADLFLYKRYENTEILQNLL